MARWILWGLLASFGLTGCASPYHSDRGALFGGLAGAGTGALIGSAVGHTGAGAVAGAAIGTLTGAAVGSAMDESEARNRAAIEASLGRQVVAGATSVDDVIAMSQAGVDPSLIVTHIQKNGTQRPIQSGDLIRLQQSGVSTPVIQAMQASAGPIVVPVAHTAPAPVIIEEHHYGPPPPCYRPHYYHRPVYSVGVNVGH